MTLLFAYSEKKEFKNDKILFFFSSHIWKFAFEFMIFIHKIDICIQLTDSLVTVFSPTKSPYYNLDWQHRKIVKSTMVHNNKMQIVKIHLCIANQGVRFFLFDPRLLCACVHCIWFFFFSALIGRSVGVGPMRRPGDRKIDTSPYSSGNVAYLSPPNEWRRTSSDSAIHQSLSQNQVSSTRRVQRIGFFFLPKLSICLFFAAG